MSERGPRYQALRVCKLCGALHKRMHSWCTECMHDYDRRRRWKRSEPVPGKAPPPPPGFSPSDLLTGKPLA